MNKILDKVIDILVVITAVMFLAFLLFITTGG
jgi:hypothetical protein